MATQRIERQGTANEHSAFTGAQGEVTYDSSLKIERSHDGSQVGGFLQHKAGQPTSIGGDTALSLSDFGGFIDVDTDTSSGDVTVTLPATGDMPAGWEVLVRKGAEANTLTIATDASETINGGSTLTLIGLGEYAVIRFDGSNFLAFGTIAGVLTADPEHATDSGTDAYVSATNTTPPADGVVIIRDFQSSNTTTTPTLDGKTITDRDGNALWASAISGPHTLQRDQTPDTYLLIDPRPTAANINNAPVARDANGRAKFADPSAAQDAVTYGVLGSEYLGTLTASSSATLESTAGMDDTKYSGIMYIFEEIVPATDGAGFWARVSTDGGSTFDSGASDYNSASLGWAATSVIGGDGPSSEVSMVSSTSISNIAGEGLHGHLLVNPVGASSQRAKFASVVGYFTPADGYSNAIRTALRSTASINAIQFLMSSGNIASGAIHIYGLRK